MSATRLVLSLASALSLTGALAAAAPQLPPAARPLPERSGPGYQTWDLGPDPEQPARRRFAVSIASRGRTPEASLPSRLGDAPLVWRLADGRRIEWHFPAAAPLPLTALAAAQHGGMDAAENSPQPAAPPAAGTAQWSEAGGIQTLRFPLTGTSHTSRLRLDSSLSIAAGEQGLQSENGPASINILDERGELAMTLAFPGGVSALSIRAGDAPGEHLLTLSRMPAAGNDPQMITAFVYGAGGWAGWQCTYGNGSGTAGNANPYAFGYVGEYTNATNPRYTCDSYIRWDLGGVLPAQSMVYQARLWPVRVEGNTGASAKTVHVVDVTPGNVLPYPAAGYNVAYYDDFRLMAGGRTEYGTFSVTANGNEYVTLNSTAVEDLNRRVRSQGYFAMGFYADALAQGNYFRLTTADAAQSSDLLLYYFEYEHNQVVMNRVNAIYNGEDQVDLYNYGENLNIGGWQLQSINWAGTTQTYTIPGGTVIPRHARIIVHDLAGSNSATDLYTGGGLFDWVALSGNNIVRLSLKRADTTSADYLCWGSPFTTPPAGTGWNGGCPTASLGTGLKWWRSYDADTDNDNDWRNGDVISPPPPVPLPGQLGERRRSELQFNQLFVWGGYNWVEIVNFGPTINLSGWTLEFYSNAGLDGTYTFPSTVVNNGEVVWLAEGTATFPAYAPVDRLHHNTAIDVNWNSPVGGQAILKDESGQTRDVLNFADPRYSISTQAVQPWNGAYLPVACSACNWIRDTDLQSLSDTGWRYYSASTGNFGALNPGQTGPIRRQSGTGFEWPTSAGSPGWYSYNGGSNYGAGAVLDVTSQAGLDEFALEATLLQGSSSGQLVIKKLGAGALFYSQPVTVNAAGRTMIGSGKITPPLRLDPGRYAFMLYFSNPWHTSQRFNSGDRPWFATGMGTSVETSATPTTALPLTWAGWDFHAQYSTLPPPVITSAATLPVGVTGLAYSAGHTATGGYGAYSWSVSVGPPPPGLTLSAGGVLSGIPTTLGVFYYTVRVTDAIGLYSEQVVSVKINEPLVMGTNELPEYDSFTAPYAAQIDAAGGSPFATPPTYNWICTFPPAFSGTLSCLPSGSVWYITGTLPGGVADGNYSVTLRVNDSAGTFIQRTLTLRVNKLPRILTSALSAGYIGIDYGTLRLQAVGGSGTATWSVTANPDPLPPGLALNGTTGEITGTPTTAGDYDFRINYATTTGGSTFRQFTLSVSEARVPPHWIRRGVTVNHRFKTAFSPNFATDKSLAAYSDNTLYLSNDGGYHWQPTGLVLKDQPVYGTYLLKEKITAVALSPTFDGGASGSGENRTLVAASEVSGVWWSDDGGNNWTQFVSGLGIVPNAPNQYEVSQIYFSPNYAVDHRLYCRGYELSSGHFVLMTGVVNTVSRTLTWSRRNPGWLHFGIWSEAASEYEAHGGLFMSPAFATDQTFFAFWDNDGPTHLYKSTDGGFNWVETYLGVAHYGMNLFFSPSYATDKTLGYIWAFDPRVRLSTDGGYSFTPRGVNNFLLGFALPDNYDRISNPVIYAASADSFSPTKIQLVKSTDNGVTFIPTGTGGLPTNEFTGWFALSPEISTDQLILAAGKSVAGLYRSDNAGISWGSTDGGLYNQTIGAAAIAPNFSASGRMAAGTSESVYYSTDKGRSWRKSSLPAATDIRAIRFSPNYANDSRLYAYGCTGFLTCQLLRSLDGGVSFTTLQSYASYEAEPADLQLSPNFAGDQMVLLGITDGTGFHLKRSLNGGTSFTDQGAAASLGANFGISPGFATDTTVYNYGSTGRVAINGTNPDISGGMTFNTMVSPPAAPWAPPKFTPQYNRASGVDGTVSSTFFWNCRKTTNRGVSYTAVPSSGIGCNSSVLEVSPDYTNDATLLTWYKDPAAGLLTGLYQSTNGGSTFAQLFVAGFPDAFDFVRQIVFSPAYATDRTILVATAYGLWITYDAGLTWERFTGTDAIPPDVSGAASDPNRQFRAYVGTVKSGVFMTSDDGLTATDITYNLPRSAGVPTTVRSLLTVDNISTAPLLDTVLLASTASGLYRMTISTIGNPSGVWSLELNTALGQQLGDDDLNCFLARTGTSYSAPKSGGCDAWGTMPSSSATTIDYSAMTGPTVAAPNPRKIGPAPDAVAGSSASLWSANPAAGANYSSNNGVNWTAAPGVIADYALPSLSNPGVWSSVKALGINAVSGGREVLLGNNGNGAIPAAQRGLFQSLDGGDTWRKVSGAGSGLESTSQNVSAFLTAQTAYGTTDVLVGINGSTTGGVYLSGDGGQHWTQVNQGFDPNNLSISSLVKTSCGGCPVQYYSGSYGSGVYTRTITVNAPPTFPGVNRYCFGPGCTGSANNCADGAITGPVSGGQAFKLCGSNFQTGAAVEFDGVPAVGCVTQTASVITCTTPPHVAGPATIRVRNPDTRAGTLPPQYTYSGGSSRAIDLTVAKAGANAQLNWLCGGCTAQNPARVYRGQNPLLTSYPENYDGGTGGAYTNTGAVATAYSYFWSVE